MKTPLALVLPLALAVAACHRPTPASQSTAPAPPSEAEPESNRFEVTFPSGSLRLTGTLWLPEGAGPHRAVVFNHGSWQNPTPPDFLHLARFYTAHGFVFFLPLRRGHGKSEGPYVMDLRAAAPAGEKDRVVVDALVAQVDDVMAALAYLMTRTDVRKDGVALTGCSFGGIMTLLTAERASTFKVAVDFAGGAMMWADSERLRARMREAARAATVPVFFLQAENDFDTAPSKALSAEMDRVQKPHQLVIYPPHGTTRQQGHHGFCADAPEVWGKDVLAWIDAYIPP
jgi:dienelactone hydrolase